MVTAKRRSARMKRYFALGNAQFEVFDTLEAGDLSRLRRAVRKLSTECNRTAQFWQKQAERLAKKA